jgi:hypothetical protein
LTKCHFWTTFGPKSWGVLSQSAYRHRYADEGSNSNFSNSHFLIVQQTENRNPRILSILLQSTAVTGGGRMQGQIAFSSHFSNAACYTAARAPNSWYSSNTCAKCCRSNSEFVVFREHVCKVLPFELRNRRISRTRVQSAAVRAPNSSYFPNTCAKYSHWIYEFVVFTEHVCKVQPASKPDRSRFWTSGTRVWGAVRLVHGCN